MKIKTLKKLLEEFDDEYEIKFFDEGRPDTFEINDIYTHLNNTVLMTNYPYRPNYKEEDYD